MFSLSMRELAMKSRHEGGSTHSLRSLVRMTRPVGDVHRVYLCCFDAVVWMT